MTKNGVSGAARFLFASEDGTISGWNPNVPAAGSTEAIVGADRSKQHAIYKGLAIATVDGADYLYATDFHHARVDVFDSTFTRQSWHGAFKDRHLPHGYAPFGIQAINGMIFVTYAKQDRAREDEIAGRGKGFVDAFSLKGKFLGRVASRGALDAPCGRRLGARRLRPLRWRPARRQLVGDGRVNAYRLIHGHWQFGEPCARRIQQGDRDRRALAHRRRQRRQCRTVHDPVLRRRSGRRGGRLVRGTITARVTRRVTGSQAGSAVSRPAPFHVEGWIGSSTPYFAYSTARVSRMTVTLIWPG